MAKYFFFQYFLFDLGKKKKMLTDCSSFEYAQGARGAQKTLNCSVSLTGGI